MMNGQAARFLHNLIRVGNQFRGILQIHRGVQNDKRINVLRFLYSVLHVYGVPIIKFT